VRLRAAARLAPGEVQHNYEGYAGPSAWLCTGEVSRTSVVLGPG